MARRADTSARYFSTCGWISYPSELDGELWAPRLRELLAFIQTQRDEASGLLHEFDVNQKGSPFPYDAVGKMEGTVSWQSQDNHETVVLGHTLAGLYAWPARLIAGSSNPGRLPEMTALIEDFVRTMNLNSGCKGTWAACQRLSTHSRRR